MNWTLDIQIDESFLTHVSDDWLRRAVDATLYCEGNILPSQLSLLITDDETVQQLNRTYRGFDKTTDVLSFAFQDNADDASFPTASDGVTQLGEVIISYPQAARQAEEAGHPVEKEITILIVHGVLHLLGYDHEYPDQEQLMEAKASQILKTLKESHVL